MGMSFRGYSVIGAIFINIKQNLVIHMWGYKFVWSMWVTHESHKRWFHSIPNEFFFLQQTKYLTLQIYFVVILKLWFFFTIVNHDLWAYLFTFTRIFALCNFLLINSMWHEFIISWNYYTSTSTRTFTFCCVCCTCKTTCLFIIISLRQ